MKGEQEKKKTKELMEKRALGFFLYVVRWKIPLMGWGWDSIYGQPAFGGRDDPLFSLFT
jgi:hypothetical protein